MCSKTLTCPLCCQTQFSNIEAFKISLVKVTNRPLICPICNEILLGLDKFTIHIFGHSIVTNNNNSGNSNNNINSNNSDSNENNDDLSGRDNQIVISKRKYNKGNSLKKKLSANVTDGGLFIKQEYETNLQFKCDICEINFRSYDLLKMHENLLHNKIVIENGVQQETKYHCHLCSKIFKMKGSLKVHLRVAHQGFCYNSTASSGTIRKSKSSTTTTGLCNDLYSGSNDIGTFPPSSLTNGAARAHNNCADDKSFINVQLESSKGLIAVSQLSPNSDQIKIWECDICGKSFTTKYFLKKHKRLHTGEMPYSCTICGKTFTFQQSYHKHLLYHSDEKPHVCGTCGRAFKELSTLHNHERIHSGEKPFKCETCAKCFRQRVSYLVHRRIHTGVMPYKCTTCEKSFRYKVSQRTHKCSTNPPGIVVRQTGDLIHRLTHLPDDPDEFDVALPSVSSSTASIGGHENNDSVGHVDDDDDDDDDDDVVDNDDENRIQADEPPIIKPIISTVDATAEIIQHEDINDQTLDDILKESCTRMGIDNSTFTSEINDIFKNVEQQFNENLSSPSEKLQNLCLYSPADPSNICFDNALETINEDCFKKLLYGD